MALLIVSILGAAAGFVGSSVGTTVGRGTYDCLKFLYNEKFGNKKRKKKSKKRKK